MALCDITRPQLFSVDNAHFRQLFSQFRIDQKPHELLPRQLDSSKKQQQLGQMPLMTENDNKKIYFCQRCLNHGSRLPRKNHKCECPYADCKCEFCFLVEKRRQLNSQLHDLEGIDTDSSKGVTGDDETLISNGEGEADRMIRVKGASRSVHYTSRCEGSEGCDGQRPVKEHAEPESPASRPSLLLSVSAVHAGANAVNSKDDVS